MEKVFRFVNSIQTYSAARCSKKKKAPVVSKFQSNALGFF
jgi:hypothetical protein